MNHKADFEVQKTLQFKNIQGYLCTVQNTTFFEISMGTINFSDAII